LDGPADVNSPSNSFDLLTQSYYQAWFRYHPERAVDLEIEGYSHLLMPYDEDDVGALIALNQKLIDSLDEIDADLLDEDRRLDYKLMYNAALLELHELFEDYWRHKNPFKYLPLHTIYQLTLRPVSNFAYALQERLSRIPQYLRGARSHLLETPEIIPPEWLEFTVQVATAGGDYVKSLVHHASIQQNISLFDNLYDLIDKAAHAFYDYARFLEDDVAPHAEGNAMCGEEHYKHVLFYRYFLSVNLDDLYDYAEIATQEHREILADKFGIHNLEEDETIQQMRADSPETDSLLEVYRKKVDEIKTLIESSDLIALPEQGNVALAEMPAMMRNTHPFSCYAYNGLHRSEVHGYLYITPPSKWPGEHFHTAITHRCIRDIWPGTHLQYAYANMRYSSRGLPRQLGVSSMIREGWALYSEDLLTMAGVVKGSESAIVLARNKFWACLKMLIDIEIRSGRISISDAINKLMQGVGVSREEAKSEIVYMSMNPAQAAGAWLGYSFLKTTREHFLQALQMDNKSFHHHVLASGLVALPLLFKEKFGQDIWHQVLELTCNKSKLPA